MGGNQYLNANAQISPFAGANGNAFGAAGLNGSGFADSGFGSQSARMGFAHGPNTPMQQPQHGAQVQHGVLMEHPTMRPQPNKGRIREVWKQNLEEEMAVLREVVDKYPYIAMVSISHSNHYRVKLLFAMLTVLDSRTQNSLALLPDQWVHLEGRVTITINVCEQTSTCSKSFKSG